MTVNNVAPTAAFANTTGNIVEGGTGTLAFADPADPGTADVAAGLSYAYDCNGDDGTLEMGPGPDASYACAYSDNAANGTPFNAAGRVEDKDGGHTDYTAQVSVANAAPEVGAISGPTGPVHLGSETTVSAAFTDAGIAEFRAPSAGEVSRAARRGRHDSGTSLASAPALSDSPKGQPRQ